MSDSEKSQPEPQPQSQPELETIHAYYRSLSGWSVKYREEDGVEAVRVADELELDLAAALALIEQESHARRLFGADHGPTGDKPPYCNHEVTPQRFEAFLSHVRTGKGSNGLSLCQLTFPALSLIHI